MSEGPWGAAIRRLRKRKATETKERWTKARVAQLANMTATTYGRVEAGAHTQTRKLEDIADALGVPLSAVLCEPLRLNNIDTDQLKRKRSVGITKAHRTTINDSQDDQRRIDVPTQTPFAGAAVDQSIPAVLVARLETIESAVKAIGDLSALVARLEAVSAAVTERATAWAMAPPDHKRATADVLETAGRPGVPSKRERKPRRKNRER